MCTGYRDILRLCIDCGVAKLGVSPPQPASRQQPARGDASNSLTPQYSTASCVYKQRLAWLLVVLYNSKFFFYIYIRKEFT